MRIIDYTLLKTPLDPLYKNVLDYIEPPTYDAVNGIFNKMINVYPHKTTEITNVKSVQTINNLTTLVVNERYMLIRNYNYIIVNFTSQSAGQGTSTEYYGFFITEITSLNDSETSPSCLLTLKWDAWTNNYNEIKNCKSKVNIVGKHFDRFTLRNQKLYPLSLNMQDETIPKSSSPYAFSDNKQLYKVLFLALEVKQNSYNQDVLKGDYHLDYTYDGNTESYDIRDTQFLPITTFKYKKDIIYIPFAVLNTLLNSFIKVTHFSGNRYSINIGEESWVFSQHSEFTEFINTDYKLPPIVNTGIERAFLTYNAPVKYDVDISYIDGITNAYVSFPVPLLRYNFNNLWDKYYPAIGIPDYFNSETINRFKENIHNGFIEKIFKENESFDIDLHYVRDYADTLTDPSIFNPDSTSDSSLIEPMKFQYPFNYLVMKLGDEEYVLQPPTKYIEGFYRVTIDYRSAQPLLKLVWHGRINQTVLFKDGRFLENSGMVTYSVDALSDYMLRNGSQMHTAKWLSIIGSSLSLGAKQFPTSKWGTALSLAQSGLEIASEPLKQSALKSDLANTPAHTNPSTGENDLLFQDRVLIYSVSSDENVIDTELLLDNAYRYGYTKNVVDNPFENVRMTFDYIKTQGCVLELSINNADRIEIENALNNGLFKHHIDSLKFDGKLTKDDSTVNNLEHKFYTDQEYVDWRDSQ